MAELREFHSFVTKFVNLWKNGFEASLCVNSKAGDANINLQVGLGQAQLPEDLHHQRQPGPSRVRRRERRADARLKAEQASSKVAAAEEAAAEIKPLIATVDTAKVPDVTAAEEASEETTEYELKIETHPSCSGFDIVEAIQTNFNGILDEKKVMNNDPSRTIFVVKTNEKQTIMKINQEVRNLQLFKVTVKNKKDAKDAIEEWKNDTFDDFAFEKSDLKDVRIRVREVQRQR